MDVIYIFSLWVEKLNIMRIKQISILSESQGPIMGGEKNINDNSDVYVDFDNGEKYVGTFFTYQNIEWLRNKNIKTGECLNGKFFWASNMIIVDNLERQTIELIINELIDKSEFKLIFSRVE